MAIKISFNNVRGGAGKTMTIFQLCSTLSDRGYKVLCIDFDPQGSLTRALLGNRPEEGMFEFINGEIGVKEILKQPYPDVEKLRNIYLLPTTRDLFYFKEDRNSTFTPLDLNKKMGNFDKDYDFVLIDTNPSVSLHTLAALIYSDYIFGVMNADLDSIDGFDYTVNEVMESIKSILKKELHIIGILLNDNDKRKRINNDLYDVMKKKYGKLLFDTVIPNAVKTEESRVASLPILEYDPRGAATDKYIQLTSELLRRLQKVGALNG